MRVAELQPTGDRLVVYAAAGGWASRRERVHRVAVPAGVWELTWLKGQLIAESAALGADVAPAVGPEVGSMTEELGQGEAARRPLR